jgi:negative regulator of genetic competence, sporulation and motility
LATLAVLATLTLAACSGDGKGRATAEGQVDNRTAAETQPASVAKSMEELAKKLKISVPDGYMLQPDEVGDTGPSDLEKAVRDDGEDDARDVLTRTRFVRGYQRQWSRSEDDEIVSYVYQFADHAGAVEYTNRLTADPNFATSSVTFVKGPYSVQVVVNGSTPTGLETLVSALAEEQYSRL